MKTRAFTLIELLTVIAIIGILAAIIIPTVGRVRETAQSAKCSSQLRQIANAGILYGHDNRDLLPGYYWFRPDPGKPGGMHGGIASFLGLDAYDSSKPPYDTLLTCPTAQKKWPTFDKLWTFNRTCSINGWLQSYKKPDTANDPPELSTVGPHRFSELPHPSRTAFFMDSVQHESFKEGRGYFHQTAAPTSKGTAAQTTAIGKLRLAPSSPDFPYIHSGGRINIAFADGHSESFAPQKLDPRLDETLFWRGQ
ncbi:MAG: prepilin-type N-terminal cleavage/methylation domain-containing protein [Opitutaceae bacterium]|jgi:general secretion pathway protein G|nr:prepilin-type N-terminal cleavage/methylation domain-containing protein [Opitutaceae bacterium]